MDCLEAQQLISAALDREPVDAAALAEAKEHCRGCAECVRFVRGLAAIKNTPLPAPPEGLAERAAANARERVNAERAPVVVAPVPGTEGASATEPTGEASGTSAAATRPSVEALPTPSDIESRLRRMKPATLAAWATAAAVLLALIGWAALAGVRTITQPRFEESGSVTTQGSPPAGYSGGGGVPQSAPQAGATAPSGKSLDTQGGPSSAGQPSYIAVDGSVYRLAGPASEASASLQPAGTTQSSLESSRAPVARQVYRKSGTDQVFVSGDQGLEAFTPVTRDFQGRTYALRSGPIAGFGVWPSLPPSLSTPTNADGSPTFASAGTSAGVAIYRLASGTVAEGIAIGPDSPASDPAAGNPNWTWWVATSGG